MTHVLLVLAIVLLAQLLAATGEEVAATGAYRDILISRDLL